MLRGEAVEPFHFLILHVHTELALYFTLTPFIPLMPFTKFKSQSQPL